MHSTGLNELKRAEQINETLGSSVLCSKVFAGELTAEQLKLTPDITLSELRDLFQLALYNCSLKHDKLNEKCFENEILYLRKFRTIEDVRKDLRI